MCVCVCGVCVCVCVCVDKINDIILSLNMGGVYKKYVWIKLMI